MSNEAGPAAGPPAAGATQAVTVMQPVDRTLSVDVSHIAAWAVAAVAIAALVGLVYRLLTRDMTRELRDVQHKVRNVSTRVDAIEHLRAGDIERIVRVETSIAGMEKGLERVERTINDRFDTLPGLIREIRAVAPRG
ncbi:hypothetical protein [Sphingomonas solaris]|uniref:DUF2730 family protein n=1 Tax=Alterirhizorhabdus solaris TaxID=2529389 RepID=A0A558R7F2_9SPHN|nr:hypothetical protein [Sphingomonas solaris]TVV75304.1 hypothetical protein FOY91_07605 [Sphingomonas solaris]